MTLHLRYLTLKLRAWSCGRLARRAGQTQSKTSAGLEEIPSVPDGADPFCGDYFQST
jgi:hypothetical protein